jgi:hypothetical protein
MEKNKRLKVAVIREELVELTGDATSAVILNQAVLAHNSIEKMDESTQEFVENLIKQGNYQLAEQAKKNKRDGWFYKSPNSFFKEIMISSRSTVKRRLESLVESGLLIKGGQGVFSDIETEHTWWKVNIPKLRRDLWKLGYALHGYPIWSDEEELNYPVHHEQGGVHHEQGGVHHEQGGVHHEQGGVHHGHQHRLLHRELIDYNKEYTKIDDDDRNFEINNLAFKEFRSYFQENSPAYFDDEMFKNIYIQMEKQQLQFFTIKEAERQAKRMKQYGHEKISDYATYFVGGIIKNRTSKTAVLGERKLDMVKKQSQRQIEQQEQLPAIPFYNWLEQ